MVRLFLACTWQCRPGSSGTRLRRRAPQNGDDANGDTLATEVKCGTESFRHRFMVHVLGRKVFRGVSGFPEYRSQKIKGFIHFPGDGEPNNFLELLWVLRLDFLDVKDVAF